MFRPFSQMDFPTLRRYVVPAASGLICGAQRIEQYIIIGCFCLWKLWYHMGCVHNFPRCHPCPGHAILENLSRSLIGVTERIPVIGKIIQVVICSNGHLFMIPLGMAFYDSAKQFLFSIIQNTLVPFPAIH